jgi:glycine cleavage system aminomethyltransferase T
MKEPYKLSPMHHWHVQHRARMAVVQGWLRAVVYTTVEEEIATTKGGVSICDVTALTKIVIEGEESAEFLRRKFGISISPGQSITVGPRNSLTVARLVSNKFVLCTDAEQRESFLLTVNDSSSEDHCVHVNDVTSSYAAIRLLGPMSRDVLKRCGAAPVDHLAPGRCVQITTARVWSLLMHQPAPANAWLLLISRDYGEYVWESILHAGREVGIRPIGSLADLTIAGEEVHNVATI